MTVEQLTDPVAYHGEGPVWSERWGGLRWVDMLAGDVLSLGADGSVDARHVGERRRRGPAPPRGGAVIGVERGFALEDADGTLTELDELWTDGSVRMNEGGCDPDGRFYCGSMAYDQQPGRAARSTGSTPTARCTSCSRTSRSRTGSTGARTAPAPTTTTPTPTASTSSTTTATPG